MSPVNERVCEQACFPIYKLGQPCLSCLLHAGASDKQRVVKGPLHEPGGAVLGTQKRGMSGECGPGLLP